MSQTDLRPYRRKVMIAKKVSKPQVTLTAEKSVMLSNKSQELISKSYAK
ncbi:hypothetical protein LMH73_011840 [Vibrio splendidus]|nr:hypothetical protein [Vibrio splendidus]MCC4881559.1 hypothetical protein [Vibrio splendidus]